MGVNWIDTDKLSFNAMLLLERIQISWFPGWVPEKALNTALRSNGHVEWFLRNKCPAVNEWLDKVMEKEYSDTIDPRSAEVEVMNSINDLITYVVAPGKYDSQEFLNWNDTEITSLVDFLGKIVIDVGSGTGRLAFIAARSAHAVYAVEPVKNLRNYILQKARGSGVENVYAVDGLIEDIPFHDGFADITMSGHTFGDHVERELAETERVTKSGGMVIHCPGNNDEDNDRHRFLAGNGYQWSAFEEPGERMKRKYWKRIT